MERSLAAYRGSPRRAAAAGTGRVDRQRRRAGPGRFPPGLSQPFRRHSLERAFPAPAGASQATRAGLSDSGRDRPRRRDHPLRPIRPGQGAVLLGSPRPGRRQHQLLVARRLQLGGQTLWRRRHPAGGHGSPGGFPGGRSGSAAGHRLPLPQRKPGALRAAAEQDPQRFQDRQLPRRRRFQRTAHRGPQGPGTDFRPRPARLGREHRARPEDPRRP